MREQRRHTASALILSLCLAPFVATPAVRGQETEKDIQQQLDELRKGQQQLRDELQEIKRLLQAPTRQPAARPDPSALVKDKVFSLGENPVKGEVSARLTLVEFLDYQ